MRVKHLFHGLVLAIVLMVSIPDTYSSILSIDRPQLMDERGNPVVNATIYIGEGNRDPEIFPKQAYADQDRTSSLGSQLTTDDKGRFPKAYIEPPYSYRIRLEDGSQFDEQLFSFGIVEIDYTPGGTGTEAINVGDINVIPPDGSITQAQLDASVQGLLADIGINSANISQEIIDRAAALTVESSDRAAAIQAAIDASNAGDVVLQQGIDNVSQSASSAQTAADSAITTSNSVLARINDTLGDGSSQTIESLAASQQSTLSQVTANTGNITSQNTRLSTTEATLLDVYGDGSNIGLTSFAGDFQTTQSEVNNPTTGLSATRSLATTTEARLNDLDGDSSGRTIEQLTADFTQLQSDVASGIGGAASVQSVNDVNVRVDGVEGRLNDTVGDGSNVNIESMASNLAITSATATLAGIDAGAAVSTANAATARLNDLNSEPEIVSIASQITTVSATATQAANDASSNTASITTNSSAIVDLESGVAAQWEVQATAGAVTGSVGLYNDGGTTKFLIKADQVEADRGSGPESLFDADGIIASDFSRNFGVYTGYGDAGVTSVSAGTVITDLNISLSTGEYYYKINLQGDIVSATTGDRFRFGFLSDSSMFLEAGSQHYFVDGSNLNSLNYGSFLGTTVSATIAVPSTFGSLNNAIGGLSSVVNATGSVFVSLQAEAVIRVVTPGTLSVVSDSVGTWSLAKGRYLTLHKMN